MPEFGEPKIDLPPLHEPLEDAVNLRFYFSPHTTAIDAKGIEPHLASADVYMPEFFGVSERSRKTWSGVGRGNMAAYREVLSTVIGPNSKELAHMLMRRSTKSAIDVYIPDAPQNNYWNLLNLENITLLTQFYTRETLDKTLEAFALAAKRIGEIQTLRDAYIASSIGSYIDHRIEEGTLPHSRPLNILATFGSFHSGLAERLRAEGYPVEVCADSELTIDHRDDVIRTYQSGELPSYEQVQRGYISLILNSSIVTEVTSDANKAQRRIVDSIPSEELDRICSLTIGNQYPRHGAGEILEEFTGYRKIGPQEIEEILRADS